MITIICVLPLWFRMESFPFLLAFLLVMCSFDLVVQHFGINVTINNVCQQDGFLQSFAPIQNSLLLRRLMMTVTMVAGCMKRVLSQ